MTKTDGIKTFVKKWKSALDVTDAIQKGAIPPSEKGLRKAVDYIRDLLDENKKQEKAHLAYKSLLGFFADPQYDILDDVELDIKDWVKNIEAVLSGERVELCGRCEDGEIYWHCWICHALNDKPEPKGEVE